MIISHKYKFIFLHCRKTAGSSLVSALSPYLGPNDIQLSAIKETIKMGHRVPRNMYLAALASSRGNLLRAQLRGRDEFAHCLSAYVKKYFQHQLGVKPEHPSACTLAENYPIEWEVYYKFCVVRNPYAMAFSDYKWRTSAVENPPSFAAYITALYAGNDLNGLVPLNYYNNWYQYTIENRVVANSVIKYEQLQEQLEAVLTHLGLPAKLNLPRHKSSSKPTGGDPLNYRNQYNDDIFAKVSELYEQEIKYFGYTF